MSAVQPVIVNALSVVLTEFVKKSPARPRELAKVREIARQLAAFMDLVGCSEGHRAKRTFSARQVGKYKQL